MVQGKETTTIALIKEEIVFFNKMSFLRRQWLSSSRNLVIVLIVYPLLVSVAIVFRVGGIFLCLFYCFLEELQANHMRLNDECNIRDKNVLKI